MSEVKVKTLFDHLSGMTDKKVKWSTLTDADKKSFSSYMINRWLSMNVNYIELVNELQKYTLSGILNSEQVYRLYYEILPKQKSFNKYIKADKATKYSEQLVDLIANHYLISTTEALDYIDILYTSGSNQLTDIIKLYGKNDKEVKSLLKIGKSDA